MSRASYIAAACFGVIVIGAASFNPKTPKLIWNASASAPVGLYVISPKDHLNVAELVAVVPPQPLAYILDHRGYLPAGLPLLKRIAALPGQRVCRHGAMITVDGIEMAAARDQDRFGRALPVWQGCLDIEDGEVFLLNWQHPDSLDGRYFGPLPQGAVIGRAILLLTGEEKTGHYEWHAPVR